jgi:hypothetical protein
LCFGTDQERYDLIQESCQLSLLNFSLHSQSDKWGEVMMILTD